VEPAMLSLIREAEYPTHVRSDRACNAGESRTNSILAQASEEGCYPWQSPSCYELPSFSEFGRARITRSAEAARRRISRQTF
jgi:hypothetical protein